MKKVILIGYPNCSTCKKAMKTLKEHGVDVDFRHIVEDTPSKEELIHIWELSKLPLKKLFNTSGNLYKEWKLKDRLFDMSEDEQLQLLSENGMLIKRPIVIDGENIYIGFQEKNYENIWA